jgi:hypothetical protein
MNRLPKIINTNNESFVSILALLFFIGIFFITASYSDLLNSGFRYFIDDHQIPVMKQDLDNHGFWETVKIWINHDRSMQRFRPYFQLQAVTITQLLGVNSFLWFSYITLLGAFTSFFLFAFGRILFFSIPVSLFFPIATLLGKQSEIWVRPMIPDAQGMFFLSAALLFIGLSCNHSKYSKINSVIAIILIIIMSLCKESYIIFIPTLISLKVWLYSDFQKISLWKSIDTNKIFIGVLLAAMFLELTYIVFFLGTSGMGYAGVDNETLDLFAILRTSKDLLLQSYFLPTIISIVILFVTTRLTHRSLLVTLKKIIPFIILLFISLIPQTLIYTKSGIIAAFYLFPFILVSTLLLSKILSLIGDSCRWLGVLLVSCLLFTLVFNQSPLAWDIYSQQSQEKQYMNELIDQIEICSEKPDPILVVLNPRVRYEVSDALQKVLRSVKHREQLFIATYGLEGSLFYFDKLADTEAVWNFLDPKAILPSYNGTLLDIHDKGDIKTIVIFDGLDDDFAKSNIDWFSPKEYQMKRFDISLAPSTLYCKK